MTVITTGLCNAPCCSYTTPQLITTAYREGSGDAGTTTTSLNHRASKAEQLIIKLWGRLSRLQVSLGRTTPYFHDNDTRTHLHWVWENVRSMSSLAFLEGASNTHAFPSIAITYMEMVIADRKMQMGGSMSFIQWEHADLLEMELLWAEVRETELLYREWSLDAHIESEVQDKVQTVITLLNRLSSYLWWSMRWENKVRGCRELVWQGYVTPFPFNV